MIRSASLYSSSGARAPETEMMRMGWLFTSNFVDHRPRGVPWEAVRDAVQRLLHVDDRGVHVRGHGELQDRVAEAGAGGGADGVDAVDSRDRVLDGLDEVLVDLLGAGPGVGGVDRR